MILETAVTAAALALASGAGTHGNSFSIPDSQIIDLPRSANGISYQLYVHAPPACGAKQPKCSVVYMLDAEYSFGLAALTISHLSDRNRIPPLISVAIGYPEKDQYRLNRTRDYTPYHHPTGGYGPELQRVSGGGPGFLKVLESEVIPFVEANFPASPDERTLVGHSYGGLFAAYAWSRAPELFDNYIIVSPSLWYADGRPLSDLRRACTEAPFAHSRDVFLAVGEYEEQPDSGRRMVTDLNHMNDILRECRARKVFTHIRVYEDETHASIFPAALSTGLRKHFQ